MLVGECEKITAEESACIIEEANVEVELDLGHSFMYRVLHPVMGRLVVLNSSVGESAMMAV